MGIQLNIFVSLNQVKKTIKISTWYYLVYTYKIGILLQNLTISFSVSLVTVVIFILCITQSKCNTISILVCVGE